MKKHFGAFVAFSLMSASAFFMSCQPEVKTQEVEKIVEVEKEVEKVPPAKVTGFEATVKDSGVLLTWKDPDDSDLWGFVVGYTEMEASSRAALDLDREKHEILVPKSTNQDKSNSTFISEISSGKNYRFHIKSVDVNLNASEEYASEKMIDINYESTAENHWVKSSHTIDKGTVTKAPTCTEKGVKTYKCSVCGRVLSTEDMAALGHKTDDGTITKAPTCTEKGVKTFKCTVCGVILDTKDVDALGHKTDEGTITTAPTCTEKGVKTFKCTVCGVILNTEDMDALGHNWSKFVSNNDANYKVDGTKTKICTRDGCGERVTETDVGTKKIPGNGFVLVNGISATDIENAYKDYKWPWWKESMWKNSNRFEDVPDLVVCDHKVTIGEFKEMYPSFDLTYSIEHSYSVDGKQLTEKTAVNNPVVKISWLQAFFYCNERSVKEGFTPCYYLEIDGKKETDVSKWGIDINNMHDTDIHYGEIIGCDFTANGYRLPKRNEYTWCAMGNEPQYSYAGSNDEDEVMWKEGIEIPVEIAGETIEQYVRVTRPVKQKKANGYGLYDMFGMTGDWLWNFDLMGSYFYRNYADADSEGGTHEGWDYYQLYYMEGVGFRVVRTAK